MYKGVFFFYLIKYSRPVVAQVHKLITASAIDCGFDFHSKKCVKFHHSTLNEFLPPSAYPAICGIQNETEKPFENVSFQHKV